MDKSNGDDILAFQYGELLVLKVLKIYLEEQLKIRFDWNRLSLQKTAQLD